MALVRECEKETKHALLAIGMARRMKPDLARDADEEVKRAMRFTHDNGRNDAGAGPTLSSPELNQQTSRTRGMRHKAIKRD